MRTLERHYLEGRETGKDYLPCPPKPKPLPCNDKPLVI